MARRPPRRATESERGAGTAPPTEASPPLPATTGRYIVTLRHDAAQAGLRALADMAGVRAVSTATVAEGAIPVEQLGEGNVFLDKLGVVIAMAEPAAAEALAAAEENRGILSVRPELIMYAYTDGGFFPPGARVTAPVFPMAAPSPDYLRGYRDAIDHLVNGLLLGGGAIAVPGVPGFPPVAVALQGLETGPFNADETATWGLEATKVLLSPFSGRGVRVAVLDTGMDLTHPDFAGRTIQKQSFVLRPGGTAEVVQDGHGHGTHCIGTACGPKTPPQGGPRYGIAYQAEIFVGKVLSDSGSGAEGGILAGINWAITQACRVVSMSFGSPGRPLQDYNEIAARALRQNTALIAAGGNESKRHLGDIRQVGIPANSPKIMSVGAVDRNMQIADFSNAGVDIVAPGVNVYSSWAKTTQIGRYHVISGTSMATPHVAGVAALIAEARPEWTAADILNTILGMVRPLSLPSTDVGKGFLQAFVETER